MNENDGSRRIDATPYAASLIEGLRDFGYNLETSLADIIDNSITAGAKRIEILSETIGDNPWIAVKDNGTGMGEIELIEAMRPGSKNPLEERPEKDLGRFGLGLKSASFSQCRSLTVSSRKNEITSCATWDLDDVAVSNRWEVTLHKDLSQFPAATTLSEPGTVVLWRKLDRLDGGYKNNSDQRAKVLNAALSDAERHLRLVFHRFMSGTNPRLSIYLNGRKLKPIDPFAEANLARQEDPEDFLKLRKGVVRIKCVTLPHHKKMTAEDWNEIGGLEGHLRSQGLYIYRADRLIIAGGWLGLAKQTEATKLCRIAVDIPNSMDADWKIDVKKASAQLPAPVRSRLRHVVERFTGTSKRTYLRRGRKLVSDDQVPLWNRHLKDEKIIFKPDIDHPVFVEFRERIGGDLQKDFNSCIRLLGAALPIETIHADIIGGAEKVVGDEPDDEALRLQIEALITSFKENGILSEAIPDILRNVVILRENWAQAELIVFDILKEKS